MNLKVDTTPDVWVVTPIPGYVLKFTETTCEMPMLLYILLWIFKRLTAVIDLFSSQMVTLRTEMNEIEAQAPTPEQRVDMKVVFGEEGMHKCFLNVCHCEDLPPPTDDIDEDELAARIDKGDVGYRIPVSIGELDSVVDNKCKNQPKIDVLVNSIFYEKRLAPPAANFFRHFFCMVVCDAIEDKHHLKLDPNKSVKLKNRIVMGSIEPMRIAKRPVAPVIQEVESFSNTSADVAAKLACSEGLQSTGVCIRLLKGSQLEVALSLKDSDISSIRRLRLRVNRDRVVLLADSTRSLYDFCVPVYMDAASLRYRFHPDVPKLTFAVPVIYP